MELLAKGRKLGGVERHIRALVGGVIQDQRSEAAVRTLGEEAELRVVLSGPPAIEREFSLAVGTITCQRRR